MSLHRNQSMAHRGAFGEEKIFWWQQGCRNSLGTACASHVKNCVSLLRRKGQHWDLDDDGDRGTEAELYPCAVPVWGREMDMCLDQKSL